MKLYFIFESLYLKVNLILFKNIQQQQAGAQTSTMVIEDDYYFNSEDNKDIDNINMSFNHNDLLGSNSCY